MSRKSFIIVALFSVVSCAWAGPLSIGTANARGGFRVNGHTVSGNATLLDGTIIDTGITSTDLRLPNSVRVTMSMSSRGTVYRDRFVLERGESEIAASDSFQLEASGLRVMPSEKDSVGLVSMTSGETIEVAALTGGFEVRNSVGVLLSTVHSGRALSFAMDAGNPSTVSAVGIISFEDGHYYLTTDHNYKYEITGKNLKKYVGQKVQVSGNLQPTPNGKPEGAPVLIVHSIAVNGGAAGLSAGSTALIVGGIGGAAVGIGFAIGNATKGPASP